MDGVEEPDDQIRLPEAFSELSLETPENPSSSMDARSGFPPLPC